MGTGFFPRQESGRGANLTIHFHLVPWLRKRGAIPLLPLYVFMSNNNDFTFIVINHNERDTVIYCMYPSLFDELLTRFKIHAIC